MDEKEIRFILNRSTEDVFEKMISMGISEEERENKPLFIGENHLTATIGFAGKWDGFVSIQCSENLASKITAKMLHTDVKNLEECEVKDALGEVINMIGGRFKAIYAELYNDGKEAFKMSVPSVISGKSYQLFAVGSDSDLGVVLETEGEKVFMELALKEIFE